MSVSRLLAVLAFVGCGERSTPSLDHAEPLPIHASSLSVDELLRISAARARPEMGVDSLLVTGIRRDGTFDPFWGGIYIVWETRRPNGREDLMAEVPCVDMYWNIDSWVQDPKTICTALGYPAAGYEHVGLPRCSLVEVLARAEAANGRALDQISSIEYSPGVAYVQHHKRMPGRGFWHVAGQWIDDDCGEPAELRKK